MNRIVCPNISGEQQNVIRNAFEEMRNKIDFGEELDEQKLREKYDTKIQAKLEAGKRLSPEEMRYLRRYNPVMYMHALRIEMKRHAVEERLKHAKSKTEVEEIQSEMLSTISKNDPVKQYMVAAVQDAVMEFKKTDAYKRLPEVEKEKRRQEKELKGALSCEAKEPQITYELRIGSYQMAFAADTTNESKGFIVGV